jgi:hypothetical protein
MQAQGGGVWPSQPPPNYIEDVFSTWLYTGQGAGITIANGIDLSTNGGMVWVKNRSQSQDHFIQDTARTNSYYLASNLTNAAINGSVTATYNTTGFSFSGGTTAYANSGDNYCSWTFRKQPKFFDIVAYSGNNTAGRTIAHNLGSAPGCMIVKRTDTADGWMVYHRSTNLLILNSTSSEFGVPTTAVRFGDDTNVIAPTSSVFTLGSNGSVNATGSTYIAYLFAHNAGGFGLTGTDNVITCGSFTTDGSGNATVNLGYEPQWTMIKASSGADNWSITDSMRGFFVQGSDSPRLNANLSNAESLGQQAFPSSTGFTFNWSASTTYIYIAIRRGPMKVPTDATTVFAPIGWSGNATSPRYINNGFVADWNFFHVRNTGNAWNEVDRLRGDGATLAFNSTAAEATGYSFLPSFTTDQNSLKVTGTFQAAINDTGYDQIFYSLKRAPSFFDEVCYIGTGSNQNITHNLNVAPELIIVKSRSNAQGWIVGGTVLSNTDYLILNGNANKQTDSTVWNSTSATSSVFTVGTFTAVNTSSATYVAYLFATLSNVSKVGTYSGTGATQTINCGFTGGARFVLIKRTDSTGDWYVWDTARGMVSGTDPSLLLNSTAAEVNANSVYTTGVGFQIVSTAAGINASGGTYIFLAIA